MYFESHAHYDDEKFDTDRDYLLQELPKCGVDFVINSGADMPSSKKSISLAEKYDYIYAAIGVHPHETEIMTDTDIETLRNWSTNKKVVAIGEIGLDYYYDNSPREIQRHWFKKQLALAKALDIPVIIHSRDAAQECFDIIKESGVNKGVIHCYSGSTQMAIDYIKLGFHIGIGGVVTFKNSKKTMDVAEKIPLEKILIETDSPYLAPIPNRGKRNDSRNLFFVVEKIAELRKISPLEVSNVTKKSAENLFFK